MSIYELILISISLGMDCFAVSLSRCIGIKINLKNIVWEQALLFGFFQGAMSFIGWCSGNFLKQFFAHFGHWISFSLLVLIGTKMIYEAFSKDEQGDVFHPSNIFVLAIATSIDALATGVSFSFQNVEIIFSTIVIAGFSLLMSLTGSFIGYKIGHFFEKKSEFIGGIILIGLGTKILLGNLLA